jgi:hypothetical protein
MSENFHRSQILLKKEQHEALVHIASQNSRSISDVAREIVDLGFEYRRFKTEERLKAIDNLDQLRKKIAKRKGEYKGNLVAEARIEREKQINRMLGKGN